MATEIGKVFKTGNSGKIEDVEALPVRVYSVIRDGVIQHVEVIVGYENASDLKIIIRREEYAEGIHGYVLTVSTTPYGPKEYELTDEEAERLINTFARYIINSDDKYTIMELIVEVIDMVRRNE